MTEIKIGRRPSANLALIVPVLNRPHRAAPLMESMAATVPGAHAWFVADPDDHAERAAVLDAATPLARDGRLIVSMLLVDGGYAKKVNDCVRRVEEPLVFFGADDLEFRPGWFEAASEPILEGFQVVGVNDHCSARVRYGTHATHFLLAREYADQPCIDGTRGPLCEAYDHSCVDDEFFATAKHRGALAVARDSHVVHLHPDANRGPWDSTYEKGRAMMRRDQRLLHRRKQLWT